MSDFPAMGTRASRAMLAVRFQIQRDAAQEAGRGFPACLAFEQKARRAA